MTLMWHEGDVIRKLRVSLGWTLSDVAGRSGVNIGVISRLELGVTKEAKRSTLARIAAAFGLTERQLMDAVPRSVDLPVDAKKPASESRAG